MKDRKLFYLLYLFIAATIMFVNVGCSKDDTPVTPPTAVDESDLLVKYLESTGGDFINTSAPAMITAELLFPLVQASANISIIDIRGAADYNAGHIQGAVNKTVGELLGYYTTNNLQLKDKVVITCYTGQTAGFATSLLRLAGYSNVVDLKWGMCSWSDSSKWYSAIGVGQNNAVTLVSTNTAKNTAGNLPTLSTGKTTGAEILAYRLAAVGTEGFGAASIDRDVVLANPSNYYIVNYWPEAEYITPGHIDGAVQYTPGFSLKLANDLKTLPTNKPIVVYCYTGQTSAHVTTFLRALGYDAKSLLFGMNKLNYNSMIKNQYKGSDCKNYPVVQ